MVLFLLEYQCVFATMCREHLSSPPSNDCAPPPPAVEISVLQRALSACCMCHCATMSSAGLFFNALKHQYGFYQSVIVCEESAGQIFGMGLVCDKLLTQYCKKLQPWFKRQRSLTCFPSSSIISYRTIKARQSTNQFTVTGQ